MSKISSGSKTQGGFGELFYQHILPKIERISLLVVLMGALLWALGNNSYQKVLTMGLGTFVISYFLYAFQPPQEKHVSTLVALTTKLMYLGASVATLGVVFWLSQWAGAKLMLFIGSVPLILGTLMFLFAVAISGSTNDRNIARAVLLRTVIISCLSVYLFFYANRHLWH